MFTPQRVRSVLCALVVFGVFAYVPARAADSDAAAKPLRAWELDELVERIALYPDVLLKALLPASTFPDQIVDAALLIKGSADAALIKQQAWDASVKVIATYPGVLKMMFEDLEWTTRLGETFLGQHKDLLGALQRMRTKAKDLGNLQTNEHQTVSTETTSAGNTVIVVQPTNPEVVYVPQSTTVVYEQPSAAQSALVPLASFGIGMALGAAMADNNDNYYYGGGYRGGSVHWDGDDNWASHREEVWEDKNARRDDQQDFRQDRAGSRQDFRQDRAESGNWPASGEQAAQRRDQASAKTNEYRSNNPDAAARMESRGASGTSSSSQRAQARSSSQSSSRSSYSGGGGAFQGYGSRGSTSAMSARGSASRGGGARGGGGGRRR